MKAPMHSIIVVAVVVAVLAALPFAAAQAFEQELSGYIEIEGRLFPDAALFASQADGNLAFSLKPEYYATWAGRTQSLTFVPFFRYDQNDDSRTHFDIRELFWERYAHSWEIRVGIRQVFWGVTESQHLVDIINQTDLVENIDGEDKLGQPMINLALVQSFGTFDIFVMPFFRERTFPGVDGRLGFPLLVDTDRATYESSDGGNHIDWALRWSHTVSVFDFGLSYFYGTSREPMLRPGVDGGGRPVLMPHYSLIDQTGLDVQATETPNAHL